MLPANDSTVNDKNQDLDNLDPCHTRNNSPTARSTAKDFTTMALEVPSASAARIKQVEDAKTMELVVSERVARIGGTVPPYEFIELIGKGAFGRVYKWYVVFEFYCRSQLT